MPNGGACCTRAEPCCSETAPQVSRTKPAEQRRADLLAAGEALFVAKGISATTLEEITSKAGMSKGLFYLYFRSKEDLVRALQEEFSKRFAERISTAAAGRSDWGSKLDACVDASFASYRELEDLHEVLFRHTWSDAGPAGPEGVPQHEHRHRHDNEELPEGHEPSHALLTTALRSLLEEGVSAGAYHVEDPETAAVLLYVTMHAFDPGFHGDGRADDDRLVRATKQLFRRVAGFADLAVER